MRWNERARGGAYLFVAYCREVRFRLFSFPTASFFYSFLQLVSPSLKRQVLRGTELVFRGGGERMGGRGNRLPEADDREGEGKGKGGFELQELRVCS